MNHKFSVPRVQTELFESSTLLPMAGAEVRLYRGFIAPAEAERVYEQLSQSLAWRQPEIVVAGKRHKIPRLQAWHGDKDAVYTYSKSRFIPEPWTADLTTLRCVVEQASKAQFNSVLVNLYRSGADGMGFHSDNERELGSEPIIASLSLGASRRFVFKPKEGGDVRRYDIILGSGDLLVMAGTTQANWQHGVPKTRRLIGGRINLTFRYLHGTEQE